MSHMRHSDKGCQLGRPVPLRAPQRVTRRFPISSLLFVRHRNRRSLDAGAPRFHELQLSGSL